MLIRAAFRYLSLAVLILLVRIGYSEPPQKIRLDGPFVPFALCFADLSTEEQVRLCQQNGFDGIGLAGWSGPGPLEFSKLQDIKSGKFRVYSMLWWSKADMNLKSDEGKKLDEYLEGLSKLRAALWIVSDGPRDKPEVRKAMVDNLCEVAERCRRKKVQLVLYPHIGCVYETAEEALDLYGELKDRGYPEIRISIHLCHELKAGNGSRIAEVVKKVAPYLALASVSGGDIDARQKDGWSSAIMPLDQGTYNIKPFLKALSDVRYKGPIELHTYALPDPRKDNHLARSMKVWRSMVQDPKKGLSQTSART